MNLSSCHFQALQEELNGKKLDSFHFIKVDVCSKENILEAFAWVKNTLKSIDVLINNAGVWKSSDLLGLYILIYIEYTLNRNVAFVPDKQISNLIYFISSYFFHKRFFMAYDMISA